MISRMSGADIGCTHHLKVKPIVQKGLFVAIMVNYHGANILLLYWYYQFFRQVKCENCSEKELNIVADDNILNSIIVRNICANIVIVVTDVIGMLVYFLSESSSVSNGIILVTLWTYRILNFCCMALCFPDWMSLLDIRTHWCSSCYSMCTKKEPGSITKTFDETMDSQWTEPKTDVVQIPQQDCQTTAWDIKTQQLAVQL